MKKIFLVLCLAIFLVIYATPAWTQVSILWQARYDGPALSNDEVSGMAIDSLGNIYVTGYTFGTTSAFDYTTIKYYPNGDTAWLRFYNGTGNSQDHAVDVAVDDSGNVYITGYATNSPGYTDYTTIKYYANGVMAWEKDHDGIGQFYDAANALAVDDSGNVFVTGYTCQINTPPYNTDATTIKYLPNGDTAWVRNYNSPANAGDEGKAIAVDKFGYIYVIGRTMNSSGNSDFILIKYESDGDTVWSRIYNGPGDNDDNPSALAIDDSGYVYVTGSSYGIGSNDDYATIKYNTNGGIEWIQRYNGPGNLMDATADIVLDDSGYIYVTGYSYDSVTAGDFATIKYYPNGDTVWLRRRDGGSSDVAKALAVDHLGNVYVTGYFYYPATQNDFATVKYDKNGNEKWLTLYDGPGNAVDEARKIGLDHDGHIIVTGNSRNDFLTIMYTEVSFKYGDANGDGKVTISDVVYLINYLFKGGQPPKPELAAGDANCDGKVTISDVVYLINYLFKGGPPPGC